MIPTIPGYVKINASCLHSYKQPSQQNVLNRVNMFLDKYGNVTKAPFGNWLNKLLDQVFMQLEKTARRGKYSLRTDEHVFTVC